MVPQVPQHYSPISQYEAVDLMVGLHRATAGHISVLSRKSHRIELTILTLSVITTGGLWALISAATPSIAAWFGAIFSTIATGFTTYQTALGPKGKVKDAYTLYEKMGREIAKLRAHQTFDSTLFWDSYKGFEFDLMKIENPHEG